MHSYDQYLRRTSLTALNAGTAFVSDSFSYDSASRLQTVTDNGSGSSATYSYLANSPLVGQIAFANGGQTRMTTTKQYDYLNRLTSISSVPSAAAVVSFAYQYNSANQRTAVTNADGSRWSYGYDALGQVTNGVKRWGDNSLVAGDQFQYAFDTIGNRTSTAAGGDQNGNNLRSATYSANNLNQYTNRTVPDYAEITGSAASNASVTIWTGPTAYLAPYRKTNYFWGELTAANASTAAWLQVTNVGVVTNGTNQATASLSSGGLFVPQTPEQFRYDGDGNLTNDGRWSYVWDAENRLVKMAANTSVGPQLSLTFAYDWQGRRIQKQVWSNASCSGIPTNNATFLYEGWNLIARLNATNSGVVQSYLWGLDLSGSAQGAGGVGGLLEVSDTVNGSHFAAFDGNGNVAAMAVAGSSSISAAYEYGPFGEVVRAAGPMAKSDPFRFSTKYQDDETDLLYYGFRYYHSGAGRWIIRDPIAEKGFAISVPASLRPRAGEVLDYVANSADLVNRFDPLGLRADPPTGSASHCTNPCRDAQRAGLDRGQGGQLDSGGVVCCAGKKYACVWRPGGNTTTPASQAISRKCILVHETTHIPNDVCPKCWEWGYPTRGRRNPGVSRQHDEYPAYHAELACLLDSREDGCQGDKQCIYEINEKINWVVQQLMALGCGG